MKIYAVEMLKLVYYFLYLIFTQMNFSGIYRFPYLTYTSCFGKSPRFAPARRSGARR